jgi:large subunit ribosomal protein L10
MPTVEKQKEIESLVESLKKAEIIFVAEYHGLTVADVSGLRRTLHNNDSEMRVIKNTLAKRALKEVGYDKLATELTGPLAFFIGYKDVVQAPKIAFGFAKENELLKIRAGYYAGNLLSVKELQGLATLPPMEELRVRFYKAMTSPTTRFLKTLQAPIKQLLLTLKAVEEKRTEPEVGTEPAASMEPEAS